MHTQAHTVHKHTSTHMGFKRERDVPRYTTWNGDAQGIAAHPRRRQIRASLLFHRAISHGTGSTTQPKGSSQVQGQCVR